MNRKQIFTTAGLGALTVALVALPSSSARKPDPSSAAGKQSFQQQAQDVTNQMGQLQRSFDDLKLAQSVSVDGDDGGMQVFVASDGGWLGARISEVTPDKVKEFNLPAERGVILGKIVPDSPAAKAGLKHGDVVMEINGQRVEGTEQFRRMIREIPAGRATQFTVWRDGRTQNISVTLGKSEMSHENTFVAPAAPGNFSFQMPALPDMGQIFADGPFLSTRTRLGIDAENLDGEFGNYFGAPEGEGILVRGVFPDSPAAKAGLKVGDVITSINGERIRSIGELRAKMSENTPEKTLKLGIIRNKASLSLSVEMPAPAEKPEYRSGVRTSI
ncbi:MAG: PDZ domain-containing protein [Candidatus Acidiferrum sp.]